MLSNKGSHLRPVIHFRWSRKTLGLPAVGHLKSNHPHSPSYLNGLNLHLHLHLRQFLCLCPMPVRKRAPLLRPVRIPFRFYRHRRSRLLLRALLLQAIHSFLSSRLLHKAIHSFRNSLLFHQVIHPLVSRLLYQLIHPSLISRLLFPRVKLPYQSTQRCWVFHTPGWRSLIQEQKPLLRNPIMSPHHQHQRRHSYLPIPHCRHVFRLRLP